MPNASEQTLDERMQQWEKEKKGLIGDLQEERSKRHGLEERLNLLETSLKKAEEEIPQEPVDERVNRLAKDPDSYIMSVVKPIKDELEAIRQERERDRVNNRLSQAYRWLSKEEKKDEDDIYGSELDRDIARIVKERGMTSMDPLEGMKAAYKIHQQEKLEKSKREEGREEAISGQNTETVRRSASSGPARFTVEQIRGMGPSEYDANRDKILEAQRLGLIS